MKQAEVAARFGKPVRDAMIDALNEAGSDQGAAELLGVSRATWFVWKRIYRIETRLVAVRDSQSSEVA